MDGVLLCASPFAGHVGPLLALTRELRRAGIPVRVLTGGQFGDAVERAGGEPIALPYDADPSLWPDDPDADYSGMRGAVRGLNETFVDPLRPQHAAIEAAISAKPTSIVAADPSVLAAGVIAARPRGDRPAVVACGLLPVMLLSRDTAPPPLGMRPGTGMLGRMRNRVLNFAVTRVAFRGIQSDVDAASRQLSGVPLPGYAIDWPRWADLYAQFSVASFEYPRSDAPESLRFVGPTGTPAAPDPPWWHEIQAAEAVVHVTQGTIANRDLDELVLPTVRALAERDVLVVVATGGREIGDLGPLPANARAAPFLDYARLLPHVDVFVTNGGYGSLNAALTHGVPIVAAGASEDKFETCARVAWSGAGVSLRTGRPSEVQIAEAVDRVRADPSFRAAAQRISADIARAPGMSGLVEMLRTLA